MPVRGIRLNQHIAVFIKGPANIYLLGYALKNLGNTLVNCIKAYLATDGRMNINIDFSIACNRKQQVSDRDVDDRDRIKVRLLNGFGYADQGQ